MCPKERWCLFLFKRWFFFSRSTWFSSKTLNITNKNKAPFPLQKADFHLSYTMIFFLTPAPIPIQNADCIVSKFRPPSLFPENSNWISFSFSRWHLTSTPLPPHLFPQKNPFPKSLVHLPKSSQHFPRNSFFQNAPFPPMAACPLFTMETSSIWHNMFWIFIIKTWISMRQHDFGFFYCKLVFLFL